MGANTHVYINSGLDQLREEITISFWHKGDPDLPVNSTLLEARDSENERQFNIHLPWSNGQIYWDCGNDGTGYDRINKQALDDDYRGQWNHWAFTKNANTGMMRIYKNGDLWHSGTGNRKLINAFDMNLGAGINNENSRARASLSEFRVWAKELDENTIKAWMARSLDDSHPEMEHLLLHYSLEKDDNGTVSDLSPNGHDGEVNGFFNVNQWRTGEAVMDVVVSEKVPAVTFDTGLYEVSNTNVTVTDSIASPKLRVDKYHITAEGSRELEETSFVYPAIGLPVFSESGFLADRIDVASDGNILLADLVYYNKFPMQFELLSFVTPYGIGIDFGLEGETWTFDVTDLAPILHGDKRFT